LGGEKKKSDMASHLGQHGYWFKEALYCTMWLTAVHSKLNLWLLWQNFVLFCTKQTNKNAIKCFEQRLFFWVELNFIIPTTACVHTESRASYHMLTLQTLTFLIKLKSLRKGTLGVTDPVDIILVFGVTCAWITWCITSLSKHADFHLNFQGRKLLYRVWCKRVEKFASPRLPWKSQSSLSAYCKSVGWKCRGSENKLFGSHYCVSFTRFTSGSV